MVTIDVGQQAPLPDGALDDAEGGSHELRAVLARGPILLGIYKSSCQASKTMFPFLERLHLGYGGDGLSVYGVSQDSANVTRSFARRLDLSFPILIEPEGYPVSVAFGITATPTVFLIAADGSVTATTMGFFKGPVNAFGDAVAAVVGRSAEPLVTEEDTAVPVFVPG